MKKLFSVLLALAVMVGASPAFATLTNSDTFSTNGKVTLYSALITAASNDTTDPADSNVIVNTDGTIKDICVSVKATNQTGTSPTLQLIMLGSGDNVVYSILQSTNTTAGTTADVDAVGTLNIGTASTTAVAQGFCTSNFGVMNLPPYVKVRVDIGGTSTPGWTGIVTAAVKR